MKPRTNDQKLGPGVWDGLHKSLCLLAIFAAVPACAAAEPPVAAPTPRPAPSPPPALLAAPAPAPLPAPSADVAALPADGSADTADDPDAGDTTDDSENPDDEETTADSAPTTAPATPSKLSSPLLALSDAEFQARFRKEPEQLGPLSVGRPSAGALVNGVQMPASSKWKVLEPGLAWGTQETVDGLSKAIDKVNADFPGSPAIPIGHISSKHGGYLPVHKSHQAGRDVDVGYYFTTPVQQFISGTKANLDLARSYALVKNLFAVSDIEMIFIDTSIQKLLVDYGLAHGEDPGWLDRTYQVRQKGGVFAPVRHVRGHKNHLHVRFSSPLAVALGRRVAGMVAIHPAPPPGMKIAGVSVVAPNEKLVAHKAHSGDTLVILAKRYGTTVQAIQRANGLKGIALKAGHIYQIPVPVPVAKAAPPQAPKHGKKGKTGG